jgi:hypothetical protein
VTQQKITVAQTLAKPKVNETSLKYRLMVWIIVFFSAKILDGN